MQHSILAKYAKFYAGKCAMLGELLLHADVFLCITAHYCQPPHGINSILNGITPHSFTLPKTFL